MPFAFCAMRSGLAHHLPISLSARSVQWLRNSGFSLFSAYLGFLLSSGKSATLRLWSISMDTLKSPKRHQNSRTEVRWEVHFFTDHGHMEGETVNISPDGVMVSCRELPPLEDNFRLIIRPPGHYPLDLTGRVVWTTICNPVSGAESIGVDIQYFLHH